MTIKESAKRTLQTYKTVFPILIGVLLLVNLVSLLSQGAYPRLFRGNMIVDSFIGAVVGSISFGIPITSYIAGGELLREGVSLVAVTAFIIAWSTVGIAMLPLEASMLGKRFAVVRNMINFVFSIVIAILVVKTLALF